MDRTKLKEFFKTYVSPYNWDGYMWADGGWGPKNQILELADLNTIEKQRRPIFLGPYNDRRSGKVTIQGDTRDCSVDADERWQVTFVGEHFPELTHLIDTIRRFGVKEQRWTLTSHLSSQHPTIDRPVYRLHIVATQERTEFRILQGTWKPSFENAHTVASWGI